MTLQYPTTGTAGTYSAAGADDQVGSVPVGSVPVGGTGRRRFTTPHVEESVPHHGAQQGGHSADPPIYRALLHSWASKGKTLPGRRDQEWNRLTAAPVWTDRTGWVSGTLVPRGDGR
ncbi:hypothetical protein [Streptomyces sp. NPDC000410]|uniref:hypothetical protein n=1 Tax=Streptomyces sp. NPDC000410 TaxID=3154254 RepID=UPI0033174559